MERRPFPTALGPVHRAAALLITALCVAGPPAAAQAPEPAASEASEATADMTAPAAVAERRAAIARELSDAERARAAASEAAERAHLDRVVARLRDVDGLLEEQSARALVRPPDPIGIGATATPDAAEASVFALNQLYEARREQQETDRLRTEVLAARRAALDVAREKLQEAERRRREARAAVESADEPAARRKAERDLEVRQLESRIASERVNLRTLEVRRAQRREEGVADDADLDARIAAMRDALARSEVATADAGSPLSERERALRRERDALETRLSTAELRLGAAEQRFARRLDPSPQLLEEVEALRARRDLLRKQVALIESRIERLAGQREVWERWASVLADDVPREGLEGWKQEVADRERALAQAALEREDQRADLERREEALEARIADLPSGSSVRPVLEEQQATLASLLDAERVEARELAEDRRLTARVLEDLRTRTGDVDPFEIVTRGIGAARDVWRYEITAVDDAPITVGSLVLALLLASVGLWASRRGSAFVGKQATRRFRLEPGAADALQTLCFYVLLVGFTLLALRAVHFPLTAFTVLGGALAIGIGFGSQNVMNNFISGLILMLERPVRTGDVVEVDSNHGTIEKIGARSTQIRSVDGRHIVVPNSFFLENNVINWTLSDDLVRTRVVVGVIYGSPTRLVKDLILQVVREDDRILKSPEPIILFDEFGDNSLNFEVNFWVRARSPMAMRQVQSGIRFRIDDLFRENGLVIAFPQRDVHLDSASPIEVRMVDGGGARRSEAEAE